MIAEHYLKKVSARVGRLSHASSLQEARGILDAGDVDLVLLDLTLPDSPLESTITALTELTAAYRASVVALSSLNTDDVARRATANGAFSFLAKQNVSVAAFEALLDDLDGTEAPATGDPANEPAPANLAPSSRATTFPGAPPSDSGTIDPGPLASKIAHDALGWTANISFRVSAMAADPAVQASEQLQASLASIRSSSAALTSFITGARALVATEVDRAADEGTKRLDLGTWLRALTERWLKSSRRGQMVVDVQASSTVLLTGSSVERFLGQAFTALFQNALEHASNTARPIQMTVAEVATDRAGVLIEVTDDGGPWSIEDAAYLGSPLTRGNKKAPSAGLGLFCARRAVERLGGGLTFHARRDVPGAYAIRIELPRD